MLFSKKTSLLKGKIMHGITGRVRIKCRALRYLNTYTQEIEAELLKSMFIKSAKVNIMTENVLIYYDHHARNQEDIHELFEEMIAYYSLQAYRGERNEENAKLSLERTPQEEEVGDIVKRLAITTGVIAYSIFNKHKNVLAATLPVYKRFTTIPAISALYLTKSLFKTGIGGMFTQLRPNADTLTITSILASIMTGKDTAALTIILLSDIAEFMTSYTMKRTRDSIKDMLALKEEYVWKQAEDGTVKKVHINEIKKSDVVVIHTGEKICVDGQVLSGEAVVDEAAVTGEFMTATKTKGSKVFAGTVIKNGSITVYTEKAGDDTVVSRIINLVEEAAYQRSPIQNYADKFSNYLVPLNFLISGVTYAITKSPVRALNMLVIDYSCGLKLSTATAFSAAINTAVRNRVLIKGGNYIENLSKADTLILDKTGTLTEGKPEVTNVIVKKGIKEREVMELAGAAEETSSHPMAVAILSKVKRDGLTIPTHGPVTTHIARGIETTVDDVIIRVGNQSFMDENELAFGELRKKADDLLAKGYGVIYVGKGLEVIGLIMIQDKLRANMKKSLNFLRNQGISEIMLLTGDVTSQAELVAREMSVDSYEAELLPEDKAKTVLKLQSHGSHVIMVGDGINDAPALAYADVGVTLGGRTTDVAMETSDVIVQGDDPMMLPKTVDLSKKTMRVVKENFGLVIGINTVGLVLSGIGRLPVFWGAVLHNSSTIFVIGNSLRLLFYNMERRK